MLSFLIIFVLAMMFSTADLYVPQGDDVSPLLDALRDTEKAASNVITTDNRESPSRRVQYVIGAMENGFDDRESDEHDAQQANGTATETRNFADNNSNNKSLYYSTPEAAADSVRLVQNPIRNNRQAESNSVVGDNNNNGTNRVCLENPYAGALDETLTTIGTRMDAWLGSLDAHYGEAAGGDMQKHDHARFFPFDQSMATCRERKCVGGSCGRDTSKIVCGISQLESQQQQNNDDKCIIYSVGGSNQWEFENAMLRETPCEVHTFDCTGHESRFKKPQNDRLHFHHVCLGTKHEDAPPECNGSEKCGETWTLLEMQRRLKHERIDMFKVDIEGFEWPLFESWPELDEPGSGELVLPMQIVVELHYQTQFEILRPEGVGEFDDFKFGPDIVNLQAHLLRVGYVTVIRDDNRYCMHCTELTLVRARCPKSPFISASAVR